MIVWFSIENKVGAFSRPWIRSKRVEERGAKTRTLEGLEELFGNDHVCIDVRHVERCSDSL